jgi:hypothetical protein
MVLDSWEDLYDSSVYDKTSGEVEMGSDFSGWNSYITGQPIPLPEMEAWRENILSIILRLNPINVGNWSRFRSIHVSIVKKS